MVVVVCDCLCETADFFIMQLTDQQITKFQELYRARFGREISREDAYEQGIKLTRLISIIYEPMTEQDWNKFAI